MSMVATPKDTYLAGFEALERAGTAAPAWLHRIRRSAIDRFAEVGFPTVRLEDWKYTNVAAIAAAAFPPVLDEAPAGPGAEALEPFAFATPGPRLVFVNGRYSAKLSSPASLPSGVRVTSLAEALVTDAAVVERHLARHGDWARNGFTALSAAFAQDGAFVHLAPGTRVEEPIHLLFVAAAPAAPVLSQPRNLVVAERESRATIVEHYVAVGDDTYLTNAVTEVVAGEGAIVEHYRVQQESRRGFHVGTTEVRQARDSRFTSGSVSLGGRLARHDLNVRFDAEGASCELDGLYVVGDRQHVDNHTLIDHARPRCTSRQLYKGVLDGASRAVFNGRVIVRPDAQRTDAHQTNKNLLLSASAEVDTKPQLEIFADDVKCTHGAAVGQLGEDAVFYLRSRGLGEAAARTLLTYGFVSDVLARIAVEPLRARLDALLMARLRDARAKETR
jgi:Fe-S cluster assembly protein SufD